MDKSLISKLNVDFESFAQIVNGVECWFARDLQTLLDYDKWENFSKVVEKAKESCKNSGFNITDHFPEVGKKVDLGSGAEREINDYLLTRYACYLIAQNGDSRKEKIAFAQSYFAIQTRKQELIEQRIALIERINARQKLVSSETELSNLIYEKGIDDDGFARIRSKGNQALFGGKTTLEMKSMLNVPNNRPLADFLPTITITAKNLATEITNFKVKTSDIVGEEKVTKEHIKNNLDVRGLLAKSRIKPEELPPEEDIKKLAKKVKNNEKQIELESKTKKVK